MSPRRLELVVAVVGVLVCACGDLAAGASAVDIAAAGAVGGALSLCRSHPTVAWLIAACGLAATAPHVGSSLVPNPLVLVSAFVAGRWAPRTSAITGCLALISLSLACAATSHDSGVAAVLIPGAGWLVGQAMREWELITERLADRARELEQEQDAYAELSVRYERARIASELHDIVAHAITVMVVQATAGQRLAATSPELTSEAFQAIATAAHQAEADMGRLVALLADAPGVDQAPGLGVVEQLVSRAAHTGLDVTLRLEGPTEDLPIQITDVVTSVVREGLTNALRYASGASVRVQIRVEHETIVVEVDNDPASAAPPLTDPGTGNGLRGLREQLDACRGQLDANVTSAGGWLLRVWLPVHTSKYREPNTALDR